MKPILHKTIFILWVIGAIVFGLTPMILTTAHPETQPGPSFLASVIILATGWFITFKIKTDGEK